MLNFPNRYPEDRTQLTLSEVTEVLGEHKDSILTLLDCVDGIMDTTPHLAYRRALTAYTLIDQEKLWGISDNGSARFIAGAKQTFNLLKGYGAESNPEALYPKLASIIFSDRTRCAQLEPGARTFLSDLYIGIRRLCTKISGLMSAVSSGTYAPYQFASFVVAHAGDPSQQHELLLNPILSEQYYSLLNSNQENYQFLVKLMRGYGSTPYLIGVNTYQQCVDYANLLNDVIMRFDKETVQKEWAVMRKLEYRNWKSTTNFGDFLTRQSQYLEMALKPIVIRELPRDNNLENANISDLLYIGECAQKLKSSILDTCGIFRAYALLQTTYQRYLNERENQTRYSHNYRGNE